MRRCSGRGVASSFPSAPLVPAVYASGWTGELMAATPSNAWSGVRELDWAQLQEQSTLPLQGAVLDAAKVTRGTRMLDDGCGTGILSVLASLRGAEVTAIDGS